MGRFTVEHWRDGEIFEKIELRPDMFQKRSDGSICITLPPGCITLATADELHFDPDGLIERMA